MKRVTQLESVWPHCWPLEGNKGLILCRLKGSTSTLEFSLRFMIRNFIALATQIRIRPEMSVFYNYRERRDKENINNAE